MASTLTTLLSFAFVLGVLVFVHELGHFLAAKRIGIKVLKFQLGFDPTIISIRRGDTEYSIGALPLGGYVKMAGENPEDPHTGADDEFMAKSKWQRFQILIAGPVMNLVLAVVLLTAARKSDVRGAGALSRETRSRDKDAEIDRPVTGKDVEREMHKYKRGTLKSGKGGRGGKVKSRKQAIAIGLSEARRKGKKVPRKASRKRA